MTDTKDGLGRAQALMLLAGTLAAGWLAYGGVATESHLGFDAYPLLAAADGAPWRAFTTELMDGRYPDGRFYRPVVTLAFQLDRALGGFDAPLVSRAIDVAVAALSAWMVGLLGARLVGRSASVQIATAAVAAAVVLLHPIQLEVIPFAARRAEGLCALGLTWAAHAALGGARPWVLGLATLFAVLAKETGVLGVPLVALFTALGQAPGGRLGAALRSTLVPVAAIVLAVVARLAVLDEIGGHTQSGLYALTRLSGTASTVLGTLDGVVSTGLLLPAGLFGLLVLRRAGVGLAISGWVFAAVIVAGASGRAHTWYAATLLPPLALLAAVLVGRALAARRPALAAVGVGWAALLLSGLPASEQRAALEFASAAAADQVERFERVLRTPGRRAALEPYVLSTQPAGRGEPLYIHAPYSLEALAEHLEPERRVRVEGLFLNGPEPRTPPDLVVTLAFPSSVSNP